MNIYSRENVIKSQQKGNKFTKIFNGKNYDSYRLHNSSVFRRVAVALTASSRDSKRHSNIFKHIKFSGKYKPINIKLP